MAGNKKERAKGKPEAIRPVGVWNRGGGKDPANPIRVRTKRLDEIDGDKIALAYWLLAKQIVEDGSDEPVSEAEARRVAADLKSPAQAPKAKPKPRRRRS